MSSHKYFCALTVSMIVGASCCVPTYAQHKMNLQSLFDLADHQNQRIKVSEEALKAADEGVASAKSAMLPSVEFSLQGSYTGNAFLMSQFASIAPEVFNEVIQSMLGDYPSPEEKDNVVDDRELTITMPAIPTAIHQLPTTPVADQPVWYTLQGVRLNSVPTLPGIYLKNGQKVIVSH